MCGFRQRVMPADMAEPFIISCDALRLTVRTPDLRQIHWHWHVAIHILVIYVLGMICQAFSCSICFQRLGFTSPDPQSTSRSHIYKAVLRRQVGISYLQSFIFVWTLVGLLLFLWSKASLVMVECASCSTSLLFSSFTDFPSVVCVDPRYLNWFTSHSIFPFIHILVDMALAWCCWRWFCFCRSRFPFSIM